MDSVRNREYIMYLSNQDTKDYSNEYSAVD